MKYVIALLTILYCPPELPPLKMERITMPDNWTTYHSPANPSIQTGGRYVLPHYEDNRYRFDDWYFNKGSVTLGISLNSTYSYNQRRRVKYRMRVHVPPYQEVSIIKLDPFPHARYAGKYDYEVCYNEEEGELIFYTEKVVKKEQPRTVQWWFEVYFTPMGDFNNDGVVNGNDLGMFFSQWGTDHQDFDFNYDGIVDGEDLAYVLANWG